MPKKTYAISVGLLVVAVFAAFQIYVADRQTQDTDSANRALVQASQAEAAALDRLAAAEREAARIEFDGDVLEGQIDVLQEFLPKFDASDFLPGPTTECTTTAEGVQTCTTSRAIPTTPTVVAAINKSIAAESEAAKALKAALHINQGAGDATPTGTIASQILPVDRLVPLNGSDWHFLGGRTNNTGAQWVPASTTSPAAGSVVGWDGSSFTFYPPAGTSGGVSAHLPPLVSQAEAAAGTEQAARLWSPLRVGQAIEALQRSPGEIKTAYESNADTNAFTDADSAKLASIPADAHPGDITAIVAGPGLEVSGQTGDVTVGIRSDGVTGRELGANVVASGHLVTSAIINEARIFNNAVTTDKIAANTIERGHLQDNVVGTAELVDGEVTGPKIAANTVAEGNLTAEVRTKLNEHVGGATDQTARDAAAAAQATADSANTRANENTREVRTARSEAQGALAVTNKLAVFGQYELNPGGISGSDPPDFIALTLSTKSTPKFITQIRVNLGGVIVANVVRNANPVPPAIDHAAPFNMPANTYELSGGVINLTFASPADKTTFKNAAGGTSAQRAQFVHGSITYTFIDGTAQTDRIHFGVNNNAFATAGGGTVDQTARDAAAAARTIADTKLTESQVDARIAPYARATPSGTIPDAQIPASIARVANTPGQWTPLTAASTSGNTTTWTLPARTQDVAIYFSTRSATWLKIIPRPVITARATQFPFDHRNPGGNSAALDSQSVGVQISVDSTGRTLTLNTTGWVNAGVAPAVLAR